MKYKFENLKQKAIIFSYIIAATVFLFSVLQIGDSFIYQYQKYMLKGNHQDLKVIDISLKQSDELKKSFNETFKNEKPFTLQTSCLAKDVYTKNDDKVNVCSGDEDGLQAIKDIELSEGKYPENDYQIMIENTWNNHQTNPYVIGDEITLYEMNKGKKIAVSLQISGIYKTPDPSVSSFWGTSDLLKKFKQASINNAFYFSSENVFRNESVESDDSFTGRMMDTYFSVMDTTHLWKNPSKQRSESDYEKIREMNRKSIYNDEKISLFSNTNSFINIGNAMKYVAMLVLLPMMVSLIALQRLYAALRVREYQVLRCIGCDRKQLYIRIWKESLRIVIPAILSGILIGLCLNMVVGNYLINHLVILETKIELVYKWQTFALAFVLGLIPLSISNLYLMWKLKQPYPLQITLISRKKKYRRMKSYRDVLHFSHSATMFLVGIFTILLFFYMLVVNMFLILPRPALPLKNQLSDYEIMSFNNNAVLTQEQIDKLKQLKGMNHMYLASSGINDMLDYKGDFVPHYVYDDDLMAEISKEANLSAEYGVVYVLPKVNKENEKNQQFHNGKTYTFQKTGTDHQVKTLDIKIDCVITADLVELDGLGKMTSQKPTLIFSEKAAKAIFGGVDYTNAFLDFDGEITNTQVQTISALLGKKGFEHHEYNTNAEIDQTNAMMMVAGYLTFIICLSVIICFYSILSFIMLAKRKELGVLRAIGLTKRYVFKSMTLEVGYMLILSIILALLLFYPLISYMLLNLQMADKNLTISQTDALYQYACTMICGIVVCAIILTYMIYQQTKQVIITEIKEGE